MKYTDYGLQASPTHGKVDEIRFGVVFLWHCSNIFHCYFTKLEW